MRGKALCGTAKSAAHLTMASQRAAKLATLWGAFASQKGATSECINYCRVFKALPI